MYIGGIVIGGTVLDVHGDDLDSARSAFSFIDSDIGKFAEQVVVWFSRSGYLFPFNIHWRHFVGRNV